MDTERSKKFVADWLADRSFEAIPLYESSVFSAEAILLPHGVILTQRAGIDHPNISSCFIPLPPDGEVSRG